MEIDKTLGRMEAEQKVGTRRFGLPQLNNFKGNVKGYIQNKNSYRRINNDMFSDLLKKGRQALLEGLSGLENSKSLERAIEKRMNHNEKLRKYQEWERKKLIGSRELNRIKVNHYGKWYLRPNDFSRKVENIKGKLTDLKEAVGDDLY